MTPAAPAAGGFRITGWHVLAGFLAFFALVIAVDAVMITLAYRTHPGAVSVTPYEDGIAYNQALAQKRAQARMGWSLTAGLGASGRLEVTARAAAGAPVRGLAVTALLQRPATEEGRFALRLVETRPGLYVAVDPHPHGAWDVEIDARDAKGRRFLADRRLVTP
jgi:nitrogen fixation protein FixH